MSNDDDFGLTASRATGTSLTCGGAPGTMPPRSREPWSNNFILSPGPSRAAARSQIPSTARDRDDLARALKERIAADMETRPRNTSPRPHVRRPETRPVSARATPRRTEITHWKRPATSARRDRRDPPAPPHGHATADVPRESRHLDASKPAGTWLSPRAQPPPLPPGHRATPLGHDFNAGSLSGAYQHTRSATHHERAQNLPTGITGGSSETDASSLEARLARERARVATLEKALRIARRDTSSFEDPSAFTFTRPLGFGFETTPDVHVSKRAEPASSFARDSRDARAPPPPPSALGAVATDPPKPRFDAAARMEMEIDSAARTPLLATPGALAAYGSGEASPKAAAAAAAAAASPFAADPRQDTLPREPFAVHRETPEAAAAAAAAAAESAVGASNLDLETTLARALHAAKRREFEAVSLARRIEGEKDAAEARASAAEARLAREAKARRAAERDAAASRARCAVFENRMEALRSGRGRLFGSGAAAASVAPEPDRTESDARVDEGNRAGYRLSDPVPERRRGADDGDGDADGFAFFEIPPEFDAPPSGGAERGSPPRDEGKQTKNSSVRGKTPGKTPRGRTPRAWAL